MSSTGEEVSTSQAFTAFWMAGPDSPAAAPIVGNPVANPVAATELATLTPAGVVSASANVPQSDLTTMSNAVPHDEFGGHNGAGLGNNAGTTSVTTVGGTTVMKTEYHHSHGGSNATNATSGDGSGASGLSSNGTATLVASAASLSGHQGQLDGHTLVTVVDASDALLTGGHGQPQQIHVRLTAEPTDQQHHHISHHHHQQQHIHQHHHQQEQQQHHQQIEHKYFPVIAKSEATVLSEGTTQIVISSSIPPSSSSGSNGVRTDTIMPVEVCNSGALIDSIVASPNAAITNTSSNVRKKKTQAKNSNVSGAEVMVGNSNVSATPKVNQRRRLSATHREMIIDLVFNEKKTSREVARYMGLPQSTVMSVVQVFKKEHRIHKKTATGRKRRLTTQQEFILYEMSQERDSISVDEIRTRFLRQFPEFQHISKTTIYRTLERGKKGLIGMEPIGGERFIEPMDRYYSPKKKAKTEAVDNKNIASLGGSHHSISSANAHSSSSSANVVAVSSSNSMHLLQSSSILNSSPSTSIALHTTPSSAVLSPDEQPHLVLGIESTISVLDDGSSGGTGTAAGSMVDKTEKDPTRHRRSLSIAEREMIISLFFNENRTIREVADFMHLAKSTVSSVVQVFRKEHRIQRKTSTGRKKKLSDAHEQRIMDIISEKDDITIEETRNKFLMLNPEVQNISKSTIYRIMENCQTKLKARPDMEVFVGTIVHSTDEQPLVVANHMVLGVINGKIEFVESIEELDQLKAEYAFSDGNITFLNNNQFLMPGLIDTHTHASQFPNNGLASDLPLLEWLQTYTFPTESNFSDTMYARDVYNTAVDRLIRNGVTTASYYGTIHLEATKILADIVREKGQRALVGKVNMVRNCPDFYKESSVPDSIMETEEFVRYVKNMQSPLVSPVITPRFAPTCPEDQMVALSQLAAKNDCHIQTHLCETQAECNWVKELFPWAKSYTEVYDAMRLLGEKTIVAHGVWLTGSEMALLAQKGVGVAHCPTSNIGLKSGLCDVRALLNAGIKVALGSDCSGGYSPSMLDAIRRTIQTSTCISLERRAGQSDYQSVTFKEAFRMATLGGAKVLNMEDKIGSLEIDKEFDALLIDVKARGSPIDVFPQDNIEMKVERFIFNGDDRNIVKVYVAGKKILDNTSLPVIVPNTTSNPSPDFK